jgi:membrane protease YdiL (CAAX protease family)
MEEKMDILEKDDNIKLSVPMMFLLGLFPGVIILLIAFILSSPTIGINFSIYLSIMLAIAFGLVPTELGILKYFAWKNKKKIKDLILYREKTPLIKMIISIIIPFIFALSVFIIISQYELKLWGNLFNFIPEWFKLYNVKIIELNYLKLSLILALILNGLLGPFVEELYFRGFLLPRMNKFGKFAPFVNVVIFSLYHFFSPWENITRIIAVTPMAYSVWINKNIKIGIISHCSLNTLSCIGAIISVITL